MTPNSQPKQITAQQAFAVADWRWLRDRTGSPCIRA